MSDCGKSSDLPYPPTAIKLILSTLRLFFSHDFFIKLSIILDLFLTSFFILTFFSYLEKI